MSAIGEYIRSLRESKNYSQRKLSYMADISNVTVGRIEKGLTVPSPDSLKKLSRPLGVPYEELMNIAGYLAGNSAVREDTNNVAEYIIKDISDEKDKPEKREFLKHIKNKSLKEWVDDPTNLDYLVFAKKMADMGIDSEFVYNEFVAKIFRKK